MMMIQAPKFDLSKEKTWVLWLGLVFFSFLVLLFIVGALVFILPRPSPRPPKESEVEKELRKQGIKLPSTEGITRRHRTEEEKREDIANGIYCLGGAVVFIIGTVIPFYREIRRRKSAEVEVGPTTGCT